MKFVPNSVSRAVATSLLKAKKNSPTMFFVGGVAGVVGATVLACRATLKLHETLDEVQKDLEEVRIPEDQEPTKDQVLDVAYVYTKSAAKIGRLYGPSIIVGTLSIAALTGSHVTLVRRNAALSATVATISKAYDEYRHRVREEVGADRERELYNAIDDRMVEKADGTKEIEKVVDVNRFSVYSKIFDESNVNFEKHPEYNRLFLQCQQNYWNHRLQAKGHVILNEVYESLGFEHTQAGAVVGWVLGPDGDNYIDFGLYDCFSSDFVNNKERAIVLDFNVDGVVFDLIGEKY